MEEPFGLSTSAQFIFFALFYATFSFEIFLGTLTRENTPHQCQISVGVTSCEIGGHK